MSVEERDFNVAHVVNLNEDPMLNKKLFYNLEKIKNLKVGRERVEERKF